MASDDLVGDTYSRILKKYSKGDEVDVDPSEMTEAERNVLLAYFSFGILGNGGFQYLFEGDFVGDPEFLLTRNAYKAIGADDALAAFNKAFAVFPKSTPPANIELRLEMWLSRYTKADGVFDDTSPDAMYYAAMDGVIEKLAAYIQQHEAEFRLLPRIES